MIRRRLLVLALWVLLAVAGAGCAFQLPGLLSTSLAVPGSGSQKADTVLAQHFDERPEGSFTVVAPLGSTTRSALRQFSARVGRASRSLSHASVGGARVASGIAYVSVTTDLDLRHAAADTSAFRRALSSSGVSGALVTGEPALQSDLNDVLASDLRRGELIALPAVMLILVLVLGFRSILAVPLVFAACTIGASLAVVYVLAHAVLMVSYAPNLVELVGFGLAIDYSLLFAIRYREELVTGSTVEDSIVRTVETAGRTVVFSAVAVALGLSAILFMPLPFMRSLGVAGVIVPLVSVAAAVTLQPALLAVFGGGPTCTNAGPRYATRRSRFWARLARTVSARRREVVLACLALLIALAVPSARLQLTPGSLSSVPQSTESARGLQLLRNRVGPGAISPIQVVVDGNTPGAARSSGAAAGTLRLATRLVDDPQVFVAAIGPRAPYVDSSGQVRRLIAYPRREFGDPRTRGLVTRLRSSFIPGARFPSGFHVWTGGAPAQGVDFLDRVWGTFPLVVLLVLLLAYLTLLLAFRSLLLPLLAVMLDVLSVAATYGMLVLLFQDGLGSTLLGLYRSPQIEAWVPVFLFATLFGLSMDYQVFLVRRMREAWDAGSHNQDAIELGLERTGQVVSAAALIMVVSFAGFIAGQVAGLQELGVGLALGVLLDATVVRLLLMPALMLLLGRWNWWQPAGPGGL